MDAKKNGEQQAFLELGPYSNGLTKREHFAGLAMQGILSASLNMHDYPKEIAQDAVAHADALLAALSAPVQPERGE